MRDWLLEILTLRALAEIVFFCVCCCRRFVQDTLQPMPSGPFGESPPTEWYPPGHGDVYYSLYASGLLENLINQVGAAWLNVQTIGLLACFERFWGRKD